MATIKTGELRAKDGSGNEYILVPNHKVPGSNMSIAVGPNTVATNEASTAVGYNSSATINGCTAVGSNAKALSNGATALGEYANASGGYSTALGHCAVAQSPSIGSVAVGAYAHAYATTSIALGYGANAWREGSIAIGDGAYVNGKDGITIGYEGEAYGNGIAIGYGATARNDCDISIGYAAWSGWTSPGSIAIGKSASVGSNSTNSMAIGFEANIGQNTSNSIAIGYNAATSTNNTIQLGNDTISSLRCRVSLTTTSDERDKTDIIKVDDGAVTFLNKIRAIRYHRNNRERYIDLENLSEMEKENLDKYEMCEYDRKSHLAGTKKGSRMRVGVSAQEVRKALADVYGSFDYANIVDDNLHDTKDVPEGVENRFYVNYEAFIPFLIKAVQELSDRMLVLEELNNG